MARRMAAWAVAGWFCLLPVTSEADELRGTRLGSGFVERGNYVRATLHEGYMTLVVERRFENLGTSIDEATWRLAIPDNAVATGLRTQGKVSGVPVWYPGTLLQAEAAAARYRYLTGFGIAQPRDPALLYWIAADQLGLQIFPCAPNDPKVVEYTLQLPLKYEHGRYTGLLPALGRTSINATVELRSGVPQATAIFGGIELARNASGIRRDLAEAIAVELRPTAPPPLGAELAVAELGSGRAYVRAELRAAERISTIPSSARLVFIFDQSRSVGDTWLPQRQVFEQLVSLFPKAAVLAIGFDRVARDITNGFVSAARATELVTAFPDTTRNGSRADLALVAAQAVMNKDRNSRRETRVFLLTDALNPRSIPTETIARQIRTLPALAQLAEVGAGDCWLSHRDEHDWLEAIESTGGTVWTANVSADPCREQLEELARPKRYFLKAFTLEHGSVPIEFPETLDEGEAFEFAQIEPSSPTALLLDAKLWGKRVSKRWLTDPQVTRIRAAMATTAMAGDWQLTDAEQMRLAVLGGAVTPMTSYLAVEPGVRPSTAGFEERGGVGEGIALGAIGGVGHGAGVGVAKRFDSQKYIEGVVDRIRRLCGIAHQRATVEIETSFSEILDVVRSEIPDSPPSASGCLAANLWDERLPAGFDLARARFVVVR